MAKTKKLTAQEPRRTGRVIRMPAGRYPGRIKADGGGDILKFRIGILDDKDIEKYSRVTFVQKAGFATKIKLSKVTSNA